MDRLASRIILTDRVRTNGEGRASKRSDALEANCTNTVAGGRALFIGIPIIKHT